MPKVSVVILNWNGEKFLKACLDSLQACNYKSLEIIIVDNDSSDGSQEYIRTYYPKVRLIENKKNEGFARGNNIGWKSATGEYILFLNNDTVVTPDFLHALLALYKKDPAIGCIQPEMRVLHNKDLLDTAGSYLTCTGFLYHYGYRKKFTLPQYAIARYVFSAKGACMLIPTRVLKKIHGFDDRFFIFFEETDLCHRLWLAGYKVIYDPRVCIYHVAGGDTSTTYDRAKRIYLTFRNMNYAYLKNFGLLGLCTIYPIFIIFQLFLLLYFFVTGQFSLVTSMLSAYIWNIKNTPGMVQNRAVVQKTRILSDKKLFHSCMYNPDWYYYYCLFFHAERFTDTSIHQFSYPS